MSQIITAHESKVLFKTLQANGVFSVTSGFVLAIGGASIGDWIGVPYPAWLVAIGIGLIGFGMTLLWLAKRKHVRRTDAIIISAMDFGWVLGSITLVLGVPGMFTPQGVATVLGVSFVVFTFFELQAYALWKTRGRLQESLRPSASDLLA